jgi:hypothetical protein
VFALILLTRKNVVRTYGDTVVFRSDEVYDEFEDVACPKEITLRIQGSQILDVLFDDFIPDTKIFSPKLPEDVLGAISAAAAIKTWDDGMIDVRLVNLIGREEGARVINLREELSADQAGCTVFVYNEVSRAVR